MASRHSPGAGIASGLAQTCGKCTCHAEVLSQRPFCEPWWADFICFRQVLPQLLVVHKASNGVCSTIININALLIDIIWNSTRGTVAMALDETSS